MTTSLNPGDSASPLRRPERTAFALLLLAGAALRLWQYFGRASLWVDELMLAANILHRPLAPLLRQPLGDDQVAPPGFLAAVKAMTAVFGDGELALRLVPLVGSLAALFLFVAVARRLLDPAGALLATALIALGIPFIRYAAELKPYSSDVAFALLLTMIALDLLDGPTSRRSAWLAGLAGCAAVAFSDPAVFVLSAAGVVLAADALVRRGPRGLRALLPTLTIWAAAAASSVRWGLGRLTPSTRADLLRIWEPAFPAVTAKARYGLPFLLTELRNLWGGSGMRFPWPTLFVALSLLGLLAIGRKRGAGAALILAAPLAVTFAAAAARRYPFDMRLILFLLPALILGAAAAASVAINALARLRVPRLGAAAALAVPAVFALAAQPPVYHHEETRPLFEELARRRRPGDVVYVFHVTRHALRYYGPRTGIDPAGVVVGGCHRGDLSAYLREVDGLRGRPRVWILIAHAQRRLAEQATIRAYCDRIGRRAESYATPDGDRESTLDLFDLSDPEALARTSAADFPVPPVDLSLARRLGCLGGPG